ncbi:hypothetical protein JCM8202v2_006390, partial [Rhodotorula sphaerocarpa]
MATSAHDLPYATCAHCFEGSRLQGEPWGTLYEERIGGLRYYLAQGAGGRSAGDSSGKADDAEAGENAAIVLGTDIFGLALPNPKIMADLFAERTGRDVYVPDLFDGDYIDMKELKPPGGGEPTSASQRWREKYSIANVRPSVDKFCSALKQEKSLSRLGFVGYCYGGIFSILLAQEDSPVDVAVCAHPGKLDLADFERVRKPLALILAEEDKFFDEQKPEALPVLERISRDLGVPVAVHDNHPGTSHGFG